MRPSTCVAGNLAIRAHIPIFKMFCCGGPCHKLNVNFFYGFEGSLWARNMASPKLMGSNMPGNPSGFTAGERIGV